MSFEASAAAAAMPPEMLQPQTQQIDVALSAFLEDAEPVDDADVVRDDDIHLDEQPLAPASAREAAVAIDEGLHT